MLNFDEKKYEVKSFTINEGRTITYREFANIPYVANPVCPDFQKLSIYVPETYYHDGEINNFNAENAPVFMPNCVGGYRAGTIDGPGIHPRHPERITTATFALEHGYVVVVPAIRGRENEENGKYVGTAPAFVVDYKAAIRFIRFIGDKIPGDKRKIFTNGTSAGGALSALAAATVNHPDFDAYLNEIGAADTSDEILGASCYCPITNLDHADMAYEWEFDGVYDYHRKSLKKDEAGRPHFDPVDGYFNEDEIKVSQALAKQFPDYVNSLHLVENGKELTLDENGEGSFKEAVLNLVVESANRAIEKGIEVNKDFLTFENGNVVAADFKGWVKDITRMKSAPSFDTLNNSSPENNEFGDLNTKFKHFTKYSMENSLVESPMADEKIIHQMNPMNYLDNPEICKNWRIRHGEVDRDTALPISYILALSLKSKGISVDYHSPWATPHSGDYDLDELFAWIDGICEKYIND